MSRLNAVSSHSHQQPASSNAVERIWRHIAEVEQKFVTASKPNDIPSQDYFDIAATWDVTDWGQLRFGINNVLDEEPPLVGNGTTARENGNTYPGVYDALGMYMFAGFTVQF